MSSAARVAARILGLPPAVRGPVGALLRRLPAADAKLLAFVVSPQVRADPWSLYRQLREERPVYRTGFGAWLVCRHADVAALARHPQTSVDEAKAEMFPPVDNEFTRLIGRTMLFLDPPDHDRLRRLVSRAFTPRRVEDLRVRIEALVNRRLDGLAPKGEADLLADLAYPVTVDVICEMFGVPEADRARFPAWSRPLAARLDVQPVRTAEVEARGNEAAAELGRYLEGIVSDPSRRVAGGLVEALVAAEQEGDRLSHDEVISTCGLMLLAGHETTANLIGNGVFALLRHPDQLRRLRAGEVTAASAVEELLRLEGPVQLVQRITVADLELSGTDIPAGSLVALLVGAANRDPMVFAEPESLELDRAPNPHLAFSSGIHACLGAALARIETAVVLEQLFSRLGALRVAAEPRWRDTFVVRALQSLPVSWSA